MTRSGRRSIAQSIALPIAIGLLLGIVLTGCYFRGAGLGSRVFWVDEVATAIRVSGSTRAAITAQLTDAPPQPAASLRSWFLPNSLPPWSHTIAALSRSPEHTPLYFALARLWVDWLGLSIGGLRSLSVLCSGLMLPAIAGVSLGLWGFGTSPVQLRQIKSGRAATKQAIDFSLPNSSLLDSPLLDSPIPDSPPSKPRLTQPAIAQRTAWWAVALLSLSPYFVAYAQEARPYSLWGLTLLLSMLTLLLAIQHDRRSSWLLYSLSLTAALYTSLLTGLVALGQAAIGWPALSGWATGRWTTGRWATGRWTNLRSALLLSGLALLPWLLLSQWDKLPSNTTWSREPIAPLAMLAIWLYSLIVIFFDAPVVAEISLLAIVKLLTALLVLLLLVLALRFLWQQHRSVAWLLLGLALPVPIGLIALDLVTQGQASATPRYWIPTQLALLLAMASWLAAGLRRWQQWTIGGFLLSISLLSNLSNLHRIPDYQKAHNRYNRELAAIVNAAQARSPQTLLTEPTHTLDLLSLSLDLQPRLSVQVAQSPLSLDRSPAHSPDRCEKIIGLDPSAKLRQRLEQLGWQTQPLYQPPQLTIADVSLSLWQLTPPRCLPLAAPPLP